MHRGHIAVVDAAVPGLVGAAIVIAELLHGGGTARALPIAVGLAAAATLAGRRRAPGLTLVASGALVALLFHIDRSAGAIGVLAPAVALYSLALRRGRRAQLLAGIVAVGAVIAADLLNAGRPGVLQTLAHVVLVAVPLLAAEVIRAHRANLALLQDRLELAERNREQDAERRAEQERMRIARELHDVVAHTLTEINIQAAGAAERDQPGEAQAALEKIEDASHNAIGELRAILGVLRDPASGEPPRAPAPGLDDVEELVTRARDGGLDVTLDLRGQRPAAVSEAASLAGYRIVQESLTNARRHAPGSPVTVELRFEADRMTISVRNPASVRAVNGRVPGIGITGMIERATAVGGSLRAGPTADGFAVRAELPVLPR